jgi:hypothetical protein
VRWRAYPAGGHPSNTPRNCLLIKGDTTLGVNKRSMTRADITRMALPPIV